MNNELGNKEIMAKNIQYYMDLNDKTRNDVCRDLNIKYTTFTDWINANTYPRIDKIEAMAKYFNCDKADLVEAHKEESYYYDPDAREAAEFLHSNPDYKVLFDAARNVSAKDINTIKDIIDHYRKPDD